MSDDDTPSAFKDPVKLKQAARIFRAAAARQPAEPEILGEDENPPADN